MGFVNNHQRLVQRQPVGQAPARLADKATEYARAVVVGFGSRNNRVRQAVQHAQTLLIAAPEVPLEAFRKTVHIALVGVVNAKALDRRHHHDRLFAPIGRRNVGQVFQHADPHASTVAGLQCFAVRVA